MNEFIMLIPSGMKKELIKKIRKEYYNYNIKFMSLDSFVKRVTFDYDEKTIYYVMKEFKLNYDSAILYLNNLYYIDESIDNEKMKLLIRIKKYLDDNDLLIYDKYFREYAKNVEIVIYGYYYINKYYMKILSNYNYKIKENNDKEYEIDSIYEANNVFDEVIFVMNRISKLIKDGINIDRIKIITSSEYYNELERLSKFYNIPITINGYNLYSIYYVKGLLNNLDNLDDYLDKLPNEEVKSKIISILNKYAFIEDKKEVIDLIINDLKVSYLNKNSSVKVCSVDDYFDDDDYVFLMGFNKENIPYTYKDNDYFSDKEKELLDLDTSTYLNIKEKEKTIKKLYGIKNLIISYKLYDNDNNYIKSDLLDISSVKVNINDYSNSNMINKILLCTKLDDLIKYNEMDEDISLLNDNYDIGYLSYDNRFKGIKKEDLYEYLDNKLTLSYTHLDNYNKCKFKYYLSNILNINIIKNDFAMIIGNVCHYLLSCKDNKDFDIDKYYEDYISKGRELSKKELFLLDGIKEEVKFIIDTLKKNLEYTTFDKEMFEKKVYVNKKHNIKISFMGVIDKLMYKEEDGFTYLVVIDYKTGNTDIKLDYMDYGIGLQLPIYLYLSSKMDFNNPKVVGFYLKKLLVIPTDNKKDYMTAKEDTLKLEGYSISDEHVLSKFDKTYNDSKIIKSMKTSSKGFYSYSKVLSEEEINNLIDKTDKIIDKTIDDIMKADFEINPKIIDGKNVSCEFCEYKDICFRSEKDIIYINRKEDNNE